MTVREACARRRDWLARRRHRGTMAPVALGLAIGFPAALAAGRALASRLSASNPTNRASSWRPSWSSPAPPSPPP